MVPKFEGEGRSSNGVAAVLRQNPDGTEVEDGIRLLPFFYSGKEIASIKKWNKLVREEIQRVRNLNGTKKGQWLKDLRPNHSFWEDDPVIHLPGVGNTTQKMLNKQDIHFIKDFLAMQDEDMQELAEACNSKALTISKLCKFKDQAVSHALPGSCPSGIVDYREADNPYYEARYGSTWEMKLKKSRRMRKYCCVKDLVRHIDDETRKAFIGTKYEGQYFFFHDALTQMTDKKCIEWMKEEGIYSRWIKPELQANDKILALKDGQMKSNKRYKGRPVGNCPDLHPCDNSLFRDFRLNLSLNTAATWNLKPDDPLKFSLSSPSEITRAVRRLWDPESGTSPVPKRILQDIKKIPQACFEIVSHGGKIVPGLANRNGHRREKTPRLPRLHRDDRTLSELGLHHSIHAIVKARHDAEKEKFSLAVEDRMKLTDASISVIAPAEDEGDSDVTHE